MEITIKVELASVIVDDMGLHIEIPPTEEAVNIFGDLAIPYGIDIDPKCLIIIRPGEISISY